MDMAEFQQLAKKYKSSQATEPIPQTPITQQQEDRGFIPSFKKGMTSGVAGLLAGYIPEQQPEDASWLESLGGMLGKFTSDYPAMIPGAEVGAMGGAALGSVVPGIGTGIGGLLGAGAGAMALPTAIDESFNKYHEYARSGGDKSFGEWLGMVGDVAKETGKSAVLGGSLGVVSKALPVLKKIPGFDRLLQTNLGRKTATTGIEYGALTIGQAALEGRAPTKQEAINNALLLAGVKSATGLAGGLKGAIKSGMPEGLNEVIKTHPMVKTASVINKLMPKEVKDFVSKNLDKRQTVQEAMYFEMLKDHIGDRNAKFVASQFKWREALENAEAKDGKFTPEQLEEMMYYRQKTGNPFKKEDSYEALSKRLPEHAKRFVDNDIEMHINKSLEAWNMNPLTNDINPREALEGIYLPGLYEYDQAKFNHAYEEVSRRFKTKNPFSNPKKFLSYMEAFKEKGLIPRYKNIVDLMRAYDKVNIKVLSNLEFLQQIKGVEKHWAENNRELLSKGLTKLIVNSADKRQYKIAKRTGYVPFDDPFLRRYVAGTKGASRGVESTALEKPKPIWATTSAPALVHPELAKAIQGVFSKDAYKPSWDITKAYDALSNDLRHLHVMGSMFHYMSLFTHTGSSVGWKKALGSVAPWYTDFKAKADGLLANKEFMMDAARSGLTVHRTVEGLGDKKLMYEKAIDLIAAELPRQVKDNKFTNWAAEKLSNLTKHLFEVHHPRLKAVVWNDWVNKRINIDRAAGVPLDQARVKEIKTEMAKLVNNIFGGQNWETMRFFNNPKNLTYFRRLIQFPDWTLSAIRSADLGLPFKATTLSQQQARKYWTSYLLGVGMLHGFIKWLYGGLKQTDDNGSMGGIRFDPKQAFSAIDPSKQDPKNWYKIAMPDIPIKIAGKMFNPGRDESGRRLHMQAIKSLLELGHWATHPFVEFFRKSNPIIQGVWKHIQGSTPSEDGDFPVQAEKATGYKPWGGSKPWTFKRFQSRMREIRSDLLPFSAGSISQSGVMPFVASGAGAFSISKGLSLHSAGPMIEKALQGGDTASLNNILRVLTENGYNRKQVKRAISQAKSRLRAEMKSKS